MSNTSPQDQLTYLALTQLHPHPDNPRKEIGDVSELAESIKAVGILQNLTVVPNIDGPEYGYTVIIGHRRMAAAKEAGLESVPCAIVRMDAKEQVQTMLLENMQRSDLTVYEQAQGFQMMLDLGSTVDEIAEKSGFSKATIRRRVKMMELDQTVLKEVSARQLSLGDFDRLAQIEDIKTRNECLSVIGTSDFNRSIEQNLRKQKIQKNLPAVNQILKKAKAKKLTDSEAYGSKFDHLGPTIFLGDWDGETSLLPKKPPDKLYYTLDTAYGHLRFYEAHKRPAPVKRPAAELEREKHIASVWAEADELAAVAYSLRSGFIQGTPWNAKNTEPILRGALIASIVNVFAYIGPDRNELCKLLGIDAVPPYVSQLVAGALTALSGSLEPQKILGVIYALFDDSKKESYASDYKKMYPKHQKSPKLDGLYTWLKLLGYEMSAEEIALQDGSHDIFYRDKEGEET